MTSEVVNATLNNTQVTTLSQEGAKQPTAAGDNGEQPPFAAVLEQAATPLRADDARNHRDAPGGAVTSRDLPGPATRPLGSQKTIHRALAGLARTAPGLPGDRERGVPGQAEVSPAGGSWTSTVSNHLSAVVPSLLDMNSALGGLSSPTLSALMGTDPRRIPWPSQADQGDVLGLSKGPTTNDQQSGPLMNAGYSPGMPARPTPPLLPRHWSSILSAIEALVGAWISGADPMSLSQFPRPAGDNGRGMHWIPTISQSKGVVDRFVRELQEMKIKWAVILNGGTDSGRNDYLVQRLTQAGIMPVMRIYTPGLQPIRPDELEDLVRHYRDMGVYYYQIYNEPNLRFENGGYDPDVDRYLDLWVPAARAVERAGGLPGFGALSPGGDVDDLEFLRAALRKLKQRGQTDVLDRAWLSVHNYDLGNGQGFLRYRKYDDIIQAELGRHMPMIGTEGGTYPGGDFTVQEQTESVRQSYAFMPQSEPYFLAYSYWIIANEEGGGHDKAFSHQALFRPDGVSPIVGALKEL